MPALFLEIALWALKPGELSLAPFPADISESISDPARRLRSARSKAALRHVLANRLDVRPEDISPRVAPGGKPEVSGCEFSISHSGPWLVIAVADVPVGVDIETYTPRRDPLELAERFFHAADARMLRCGGVNFMRQWVAKEAALKAAGTGLSDYLHKARCVVLDDAVRGVAWDDERYAIREFSLDDGTPGALAARGGIEFDIAWHDPAEAGIN